MARSRAIDIRLERMVPAMEEYLVKGIFTRDELHAIARQRANHEYKLVARPLLFVDARRAIDFELELDTRVANFLRDSPQQMRHRWAVIERVVHIYDIAVPQMQAPRERELLELQYLTFLRDFSRVAELSRYIAAELQRSPANIAVWVFAVEWELSKGSVDAARSLAQEALKHGAADPRAWVALLGVETHFVEHVARAAREADKTARAAPSAPAAAGSAGTGAAARLAAANPALASVVIDGELVATARRAALQSPAAGSELLRLAHSTLLPRGVMTGRDVARLFAEAAASACSSAPTARAARDRSDARLAVTAAALLVTSAYSFFTAEAPSESEATGDGGGAAAAARARAKRAAVGEAGKYWCASEFIDASHNGSIDTSTRSALAARTLQQLVVLARATSSPEAAKAAVQFAERAVVADAAMPEDRAIAALSGREKAPRAAHRAHPCFAALDECVAALPAELLHSAGGTLASLDGAAFAVDHWVGERFAAALRAADFSCATALAPAVCGSAGDADLAARARAFLAGGATADADADAAALASGVDAWFARVTSDAAARTHLLAGDAAATEATILLVCRGALVAARASSAPSVVAAAAARAAPSERGRLPLRRPRDASESDEDDDNDNKGAGGAASGRRARVAPAMRGFAEAIDLLRSLVPASAQQLASRGRCVACVACAWLDAEARALHPALAAGPMAHAAVDLWPVTSGAAAASAPSTTTTRPVARSGRPALARQLDEGGAELRTRAREIVDRSAAVLPASLELLVGVGAACEFAFAGAVGERARAETRMRAFFEAALSQRPNERATWARWKAYETALANLKEAAAVQRRAATALGDARPL
jgi:hypothetical protein